MKAQIRTYILVVGRDQNDEPYRALAPYHVPMPMLTDHYDTMSNNQLNAARRAVNAERALLERAAADLEVEAYSRLEAVK